MGFVITKAFFLSQIRLRLFKPVIGPFNEAQPSVAGATKPAPDKPCLMVMVAVKSGYNSAYLTISFHPFIVSAHGYKVKLQSLHRQRDEYRLNPDDVSHREKSGCLLSQPMLAQLPNQSERDSQLLGL